RSRCPGAALLLALVLLLAGWGMAPGALQGQVAMERQVPLLPSEGIEEMGSELRQRLGAFSDVEGFRVARLFQRSDDDAAPYVLEVEARVDGVLVRRREPLSANELASRRSAWTERLQAPEMDRRLVSTQEGRGRLVWGQTLLALGYHGWAVPVALDVNSSRGAVGTYLLTAGAGFYLTNRLTRNRTVTHSHRMATGWGGSRGIVTGVFLADALQGRSDDQSSSDRGRVRLGGGVVGGAGGAVGGFLTADRIRPDPGTARLWGAMGDLGLAGGAALAVAAGPWSEEEVVRQGDGFEFTETRRRNPALGSGLLVAGGAVGTGAGLWLGGRRAYSEGDVPALRSAMVLGTQSVVTATRLAGADDQRALAGAGLAGAVAGTVLGDRVLRDRELTIGEGLQLNAAHVAGGATALGLTYLAADEMGGRSRLYLATSTAGSLLGAGLMWRSMRPVGTGADAGAGRGGAASARVHLDPVALFLNGGADTRQMAPVLRVTW
ncbi:MAG: hypothetical protein EA352_03495, partial [Gemmatimonadales bacterium]